MSAVTCPAERWLLLTVVMVMVIFCRSSLDLISALVLEVGLMFSLTLFPSRVVALILSDSLPRR